MSDPDLRPERPEDSAVIGALVEAAFGGPGEARLVAGLREAKALELSLVAWRDGAAVGHVAFSPVTVQGSVMPGVFGLAPLAVAPAAQRQRIGSALVREGLSRLKAGGCRVVVVLGDPVFYRRFGFRPASAVGLSYPGAWPEEAFQAMMLSPPLVRGLVRYHRLFDAL